jgi:hypothetical protein
MMRVSFADFLRDTLGIPARFRDEWGIKLLRVITGTFDAIAAEQEAAAWCGSPLYAPEDALETIGWERSIERGPSETAAHYRARVHGAWEAWTWGGTVTGVTSQLVAYGLTPTILEARQAWADDPNWSRFWVFLPAGTHPYSGSVPLAEQLTLRRIVRRWKDAHTVCAGFVVMVSGRTYGYTNDGLTYGEADTAGMTYGDAETITFGG